MDKDNFKISLSKDILNVSLIVRFVSLIEMVMKSSAFWDPIPWSENTITISDYSSTLKVEATRSFETSVNFQGLQGLIFHNTKSIKSYSSNPKILTSVFQLSMIQTVPLSFAALFKASDPIAHLFSSVLCCICLNSLHLNATHHESETAKQLYMEMK